MALTEMPQTARQATPRAPRAFLPRGREYLVAGAIFLALTIVFFNPVFRGFTFSDVGAHQNSIYPWKAHPTFLPDRFPQSDQADTYYPWQVFINRSLRAGSIPLWNPYSFGGQPFFANGQNGALYPPKLLLSMLVSANWVHDLLLMGSLFLSGLAMFALLKGYGCGFFGALLAGIAWMFSTYNLAWIQFEISAPIMIFLPLALLCVYRSAIARSWRFAMAAGTMLGFIFLGSSILYAIIVSIICGLYGVLLSFRLLFPLQRSKMRREIATTLFRLTLLPLMAFGVCAIQLLPTLVLSQSSGRNVIPYSNFHTIFAVPPSAFWNTFHAPSLPVYTRGEYPATFAGQLLPRFYVMAFSGLPTALFAVVGFFQRRSGAMFARILAATAFLVLVGTPATWLAYHLIPGFSNYVGLGRLLFLWDFAVALLGGIGLDACLCWFRDPQMPPFLPFICINRIMAPLHNYRQRILGVIDVITIGAIVLTAGQLGTYGRTINPPFEPRQSQYFYPTTPLIDAIRADRDGRTAGSLQRLISVGSAVTLYASEPMLFGFESVSGYDSLVPDRTVALWRVLGGQTPDEALTTKVESAYSPLFLPKTTRFDLLPRLGITTLVAPPDIDGDPNWTGNRVAPLSLRPLYRGMDGQLIAIYAPTPVTRAYIVHNAEYAATPLDALNRFIAPSFDYREHAIFERPTAGVAQITESAPAVLANDAAIVQYHGTNDLSIDVRTTTPGWVVLTDMWAPGWKTTVNGKASDVLRADFAFRAVAVPAGHTQIEMHYRPAAFIVGTVTTVGTAIVMSLVLISEYIYRRRKWRVKV